MGVGRVSAFMYEGPVVYPNFEKHPQVHYLRRSNGVDPRSLSTCRLIPEAG
jgi:hypothetical protein